MPTAAEDRRALLSPAVLGAVEHDLDRMEVELSMPRWDSQTDLDLGKR